MGYVSPGSLDNLKQYKYSVKDVSPFSIYVLQPYWNYMIRFMPWNIAPNLITLIGTLGLLFNYFLVAYYIPDFDSHAPAWVYLSSAIAIEWYSLFDNLDGRQARRTKTSSPLGELFDHGCDCLAVSVAACTSCSIFQFGPGIRAVIIHFVTSFTFWLATWEEYHTGTLFLGYINGPTEGLKIILVTYLATFIWGPQIWLYKLKDIATVLPAIDIRDFFVYGVSVLPLIITIYYNYQSVSLHLKAQKKPIGPAILNLLTVFIYFGMASVWYYCSASLWWTYPHFVHMALGLGFSEMASRLILAHLCKMPYNMLQRPMIPLLLVTLNSVYNYVSGKPLVSEYYVVLGFLALSTFAFLHYTLSVVTELCGYLKIKALTIPYQDPAKRNA